jgi:signal transduction histidine kinase
VKVESETTKIIQGEDRIRSAILDLISRSQTRLDILAADVRQGQNDNNEDFIEALLEAKSRGVGTRMVTEVTKSNLPALKLAVELIELRHVQGLKGNFAVTDTEYMSSPTVGEALQPFPVIYSNSFALVEEHQFIFEKFWAQGVPLDERVKEIETGTAGPSIELIRETDRIKELYLSLVMGAKREVLLLLPSSEAFHREEGTGILDALEAAAARGVKLRLLAPLDPSAKDRLARVGRKNRGEPIAFRETSPADTSETITMLIVDRTSALSIEERDPKIQSFDEAVGTATYSTGDYRVKSSRRLFERIWRETERREAEERTSAKERRSRMRAELMQDILTHDIRNFNQVSRLNAELINEKVTTPELKKRISAILRAIDGSSRLIDMTKRLGSIIAEVEVNVRPISLRESFERSLSLVRKSNPGVVITSPKLSGKVLADRFLDDVFTNILSNSVKYTEGPSVTLQVTQEPVNLKERGKKKGNPFWKITISDLGRGIPDELKPTLFRRYLETAGGSGLGLSIVHALVVERYSGKVSLSDRVKGDHKKGTKVEIWLPRG